MIVEIKDIGCGMRAYSRIDVPHDWNPNPLNTCGTCGRETIRWTVMVGHWCDHCAASACDKTCTQPFWDKAA